MFSHFSFPKKGKTKKSDVHRQYEPPQFRRHDRFKTNNKNKNHKTINTMKFGDNIVEQLEIHLAQLKVTELTRKSKRLPLPSATLVYDFDRLASEITGDQRKDI
jgi:hypothetical protein